MEAMEAKIIDLSARKPDLAQWSLDIQFQVQL